MQKATPYYNEIMTYFESVKNHPLLDSVNYSRGKWEYYLSFRTDAFAFEFDENNRLKRTNKFYATGLNAFDKNIDLVNDFVEKSNFRQFYKEHIPLYEEIISNYKEFYLINETRTFLDAKIGKPKHRADLKRYLIVLSPLIYRMNCHRMIDAETEADFPALTTDFILGKTGEDMLTQRIVENHVIFTEMDHGYINPISDKYIEDFNRCWDSTFWDNNSGYDGINCFNEYMTWAVYDIFVKENYLDVADSITTQWHYQNISRGFIASDLFAEKVWQLYKVNNGQKFENIYPPLFAWISEIQSTIIQPILQGKGLKKDDYRVVSSERKIELLFSEPMNKSKQFGIIINELKDGKSTNKSTTQVVDNPNWSEDGMALTFILNDFGYDEFYMLLNWWGIKDKLSGKNGVALDAGSVVFCRII